MFSFLRGTSPPRTNQASTNPIIYEQGRSSVEFHAPNSEYIMTHRIAPNTTEHGISILQPPFHLHVYQDEVFRLRSGVGNFFLGLDTKPFITLSQDGPMTTFIPRGRYHRFENVSETEDLVVDILLRPEAYEVEERFFRNFFGYLDDCRMRKMEPSIFQIMLFLHNADIAIAVPLPWESGWISRFVTFVFASWGTWGLGYKTSYEEYYHDAKSK